MTYFVGDYLNNGRYLIPTYEQMLLEKDTYTIKNLQEKLDNLRKQNDEQKTKITELEGRVAVAPGVPRPPPLPGNTISRDRFNAVTRQRDGLQRAKRDAEKKIQELRQNLEAAQTRAQQAEADKDEANAEVERLTETLQAEQNRARQEEGQLREELQAAQTRVQQVEAELIGAKAEVVQ